MSLFFNNKKSSLFSKPYESLFDRSRLVERQGEAANRFLAGTPTIEDLRILGYTQYCGSTSDCGFGSQCVDGFCVPVGAGNTQYGEGGCSSGPSNNPPAALPCLNCGYNAEDKCAGSRICRFTPFGVQCWCGGTGPNGGDGTGPNDDDTGKPCSKWCTNEYASFGSYSEGCDDSNTCDECFECETDTVAGGDQCVKKESGAPCHCNQDPYEACGGPVVELECCNFRDTCQGRIEGLYCYDRYRIGIPRCYDPEVPCPDPETDCFGPCVVSTIEDSSGEDFDYSSLEEGCSYKGTIKNEATGDQVHIIECCPKDEEKAGCGRCYSDNDCPEDFCCNFETGICEQCPPVTCEAEGGLILSDEVTKAVAPLSWISLDMCQCYTFYAAWSPKGGGERYALNPPCTTVIGTFPRGSTLISYSMDLVRDDHVAVTNGFFTQFYNQSLRNYWPINIGSITYSVECGEPVPDIAGGFMTDGVLERMATILYMYYIPALEGTATIPYSVIRIGYGGASYDMPVPEYQNWTIDYEGGYTGIAYPMPCPAENPRPATVPNRLPPTEGLFQD